MVCTICGQPAALYLHYTQCCWLVSDTETLRPGYVVTKAACWTWRLYMCCSLYLPALVCAEGQILAARSSMQHLLPVLYSVFASGDALKKASTCQIGTICMLELLPFKSWLA